MVRSLVKLKTISYVTSAPSHVSLASRSPIEDVELLIPLPQEMKQQEAARVTKAIEKTKSGIERAEAQIQKMFPSQANTSRSAGKKMKASLEQQRRELSSLTQQLQLLS